MPLLTITAPNVPASVEDQTALMKRLSSKVAKALDKPERWMMVSLHRPVAIMFGGDVAAACHVSLFSVGQLDPARNEAMAALICEDLQDALHIPSDRIYIQFADVAGASWGWNRETFAE